MRQTQLLRIMIHWHDSEQPLRDFWEKSYCNLTHAHFSQLTPNALDWTSTVTLDERDSAYATASSFQSACPLAHQQRARDNTRTTSVISLTEDTIQPLMLNLKEGMINKIK